MGSIPGSGRTHGEGNSNPLLYSGLEIPWTEEPGGPQSMGSQRVGHNLATKQQQQVAANFPRLWGNNNIIYLNYTMLKMKVT